MLVAYAKLALKADLLAERARPTTRGSQQTLAQYFPHAMREQYADELAAAPAAPRDHHQLRRQLDGQPRRHHLRLPGAGGDRRHPRAGRPRVRRLPRGVRPGGLRRARSRRSTTSCRPQTQTDALPRVPAAPRPRGPAGSSPSRPSQPRHRRRGRAVRGRCRGARAAGAELLQRRREERGWRSGPPSWRGRGLPPTSPRAPRSLLDWFSLLDIVDIADRHRPRRRARSPPLYYVRLGAVRHRRDAHQGQPACRATTAGTPWPAAPCATTSTPCSSP